MMMMILMNHDGIIESLFKTLTFPIPSGNWLQASQLLRYNLTLSLQDWFDTEISEINAELSEMSPSNLYRSWCSVWFVAFCARQHSFCLLFVLSCRSFGMFIYRPINARPVRNIVASIFLSNAVRLALRMSVCSYCTPSMSYVRLQPPKFCCSLPRSNICTPLLKLWRRHWMVARTHNPGILL